MKPDRYEFLSSRLLRFLLWVESVLLLLAMTDQVM